MGLAGIFSGIFGGSKQVDLWKRFERLRESYSGTMSSFYKVRDRQDGQVKGLKVIDREKSAPIEARYKELKKPTEGEIGMQIKGPHIATTLEWGTATTGDPYVLQDFVEGTLLHNLVAAGRSLKPLPPPQRLDLVRQAAQAIASVHAAGFVHRDICPRNYILRRDGKLILFDFGLTVPDRPAFLQPGNRIGTPNYMAPEVVRRRQADKRIDIFSFGITAYEICTIAAPWPRGTTGTAALAHDSTPDPIDKHWRDIPFDLGEAIMRCLAADPALRHGSMEQFLSSLSGVKL